MSLQYIINNSSVQQVAQAPEVSLSGLTQNPSSLIVEVGESGNHVVTMYDVKGKVVFTRIGTGNRHCMISRKSIRSGVYILQIKAKEKLMIKTLTECVE